MCVDALPPFLSRQIALRVSRERLSSAGESATTTLIAETKAKLELKLAECSKGAVELKSIQQRPNDSTSDVLDFFRSKTR